MWKEKDKDAEMRKKKIRGFWSEQYLRVLAWRLKRESGRRSRQKMKSWDTSIAVLLSMELVTW